MEFRNPLTCPTPAVAIATLVLAISPLAPASAALLITEVMANPAVVSDHAGEWFEVYNPGAQSIDLDGTVLSDDGSNFHMVSGNGLQVDPGEYFVFGNNGESGDNGGYSANYVYSGFTLANTSDEIVLSHNQQELARLNYGNGSVFGQPGISAELLSVTSSPFTAADYGLTPSALTYGAGDRGSPGEAGSAGLPYPAPAPVPAPPTLSLMLAALAAMGVLIRQSMGRAGAQPMAA